MPAVGRIIEYRDRVLKQKVEDEPHLLTDSIYQTELTVCGWTTAPASVTQITQQTFLDSPGNQVVSQWLCYGKQMSSWIRCMVGAWCNFTERLNVEFCRKWKLLLNRRMYLLHRSRIVRCGHRHTDWFASSMASCHTHTKRERETCLDSMLKANQAHMLCIQPMD
jgi:hypothetical protein